MDKKIVLTIGDSEVVFNVSLIAYNQCVDELQTDKKIAPMYRFLQRCVVDKKQLSEYYQLGLIADIFGAVIDEYKPKLEITVKK